MTRGAKPKVVRMVPRKYKRGWLHALDRRSGIYLALTARLQELMQDLGGEDNLSYQQRSLCKRAIWIEARLMAIEEEVAAGGADDHAGKYGYLTNSLIGLYRQLGLERQVKNIGSLKDYIEGAVE